MCHDKSEILKERLLKQDKTIKVLISGMTDFAHLNDYTCWQIRFCHDKPEVLTDYLFIKSQSAVFCSISNLDTKSRFPNVALTWLN